MRQVQITNDCDKDDYKREEEREQETKDFIDFLEERSKGNQGYRLDQTKKQSSKLRIDYCKHKTLYTSHPEFI